MQNLAELLFFAVTLAILIGGATAVFIAVGGLCTELREIFQAHGLCGVVYTLAFFTIMAAMPMHCYILALTAFATMVLMVALVNLFGPK